MQLFKNFFHQFSYKLILEDIFQVRLVEWLRRYEWNRVTRNPDSGIIIQILLSTYKKKQAKIIFKDGLSCITTNRKSSKILLSIDTCQFQTEGHFYVSDRESQISVSDRESLIFVSDRESLFCFRQRVTFMSQCEISCDTVTFFLWDFLNIFFANSLTNQSQSLYSKFH